MKKEIASKLYTSTQKCIKELNVTLIDIRCEMDQGEFNQVKKSVAQVMGRLVDICDLHIYPSHPDLRAYSESEE